MADHSAEIAAIRNDIQTLRSTKQDRISSSIGNIPQGTEGADGDTTYRLTPDKGLLMFHKFAGAWYSSPFNVGNWNLEDSINEVVQDITISNVTIEESTLASQNISGTLTILNAGTFALDTSATVTGLSHSDLDDVGTGTGTGGNAHPQYTGTWSIDASQTLTFGTAQEAGNITVGAVEVVLDGNSLFADGDGLSVNESGYAFTLDNTLTLQPTSSTSLHISSAYTDKIKLTDDSKDVIIGSSDAGDLYLTPVDGASVLIQGNNTAGGEPSNEHNCGVGSSSYASGLVGGAGWALTRPTSGFSANEWMLEVDNMSVRGTLSVFELLINQIRATNGTLFVSSVAKVFSIIDGSNLAFEDPSGNGLTPFAVDDILLCQRVEVGTAVDAYSDTNTNFVKRVVIQVTAVGSTTIDDNTYGTITYSTTASGPTYVGVIAEGDDFVRIGSTSDTARRASILLTSDFANAPFIDFIDGVSSWETWKGTAKNKARIGNLTGLVDPDITGSLTGYGLYADNVFLKGEVQANSGYIGTKDAGWTINSSGISTDVAGRKIYMGTGANADVYGDQDCWFLAESYDPGDGDIEARISLGNCFKVDSDSHTIELRADDNNYIKLQTADSQIVVRSNDTNALTFTATDTKLEIGDSSLSNPNYLQYKGSNGDFTLVSHGDQYFKVASGATPTVTIGNPVGNSTNWMELTGGSFKLWNRNAAGTAEDFITMDSEGNANFKGTISLTSSSLSSDDLSDVDAYTTDQDQQTLSGLVDDVSNPLSAGLYMNSSFLGFHNGDGQWTSYMTSSGSLMLKKTDGSITGLYFNSATGDLTVNGGGTFSGDISAASGTFTGNLSGATITGGTITGVLFDANFAEGGTEFVTQWTGANGTGYHYVDIGGEYYLLCNRVCDSVELWNGDTPTSEETKNLEIYKYDDQAINSKNRTAESEANTEVYCVSPKPFYTYTGYSNDGTSSAHEKLKLSFLVGPTYDYVYICARTRIDNNVGWWNVDGGDLEIGLAGTENLTNIVNSQWDNDHSSSGGGSYTTPSGIKVNLAYTVSFQDTGDIISSWMSCSLSGKTDGIYASTLSVKAYRYSSGSYTTGRTLNFADGAFRVYN